MLHLDIEYTWRKGLILKNKMVLARVHLLDAHICAKHAWAKGVENRAKKDLTHAQSLTDRANARLESTGG
jgi:hypothetical protein